MPATDPRELGLLRDEHTEEAVAARIGDQAGPSYVRDFIFGAIDGTITTFAVVAGSLGAGLSTGVLLVLGMANVLADGFSMGVSNFLGTRAERQLNRRVREMEMRHIVLVPDGEREEIRQIYRRKGFEGDDLERVVATITADPELWVDTMLREEHGLAIEERSAPRAAISTFAAFAVAGLLPLLPFMIDLAGIHLPLRPSLWSMAATGTAFFLIGAAKGLAVGQRWYVSAGETLLFGSVAALVALMVGILGRDLVD